RLRTEEHRLKRTLNALKPVAHRAQCKDELTALGPVVALPPEQSERRLESMQALRASARESERLNRDLEELRADRGALEVPEPLVEVDAQQIAEFSERLAVTRKALRDLPSLQGQIRAREDSVQNQLLQLPKPPGLDEIERLRLSGPDHARIRRLIQE